MIGKRDKFSGGFEKQSALKLRWRRAADCSSGGFWQPETHDRQQWTAVYVGSVAAMMTTTGDGGGWKRRRSGCSRKDTVAPGRAGIGKWAQLTWNRCVPEIAASVGLAALVCTVSCSYREDRCISLAAALRTDWSRLSWDAGSPASVALQ